MKVKRGLFDITCFLHSQLGLTDTPTQEICRNPAEIRCPACHVCLLVGCLVCRGGRQYLLKGKLHFYVPIEALVQSSVDAIGTLCTYVILKQRILYMFFLVVPVFFSAHCILALYA